MSRGPALDGHSAECKGQINCLRSFVDGGIPEDRVGSCQLVWRGRWALLELSSARSTDGVEPPVWRRRPGRRVIVMQTNELLERVFRTCDGVFAIDDEQRIIFWNEGAEAILGYAPEEVKGKRCFLLIQGVDESGQVSCIQDCSILCGARLGKLSPAQNLQVRAKDGLLRWLSGPLFEEQVRQHQGHGR